MKSNQIKNTINNGNCVFGTMLTNSISPRWAGHFDNIGFFNLPHFSALLYQYFVIQSTSL